MSTDVLTAIGDVIGGVGVAVAAYFGYRAAVAGRQAVEQARIARREERLHQDLGRQERLLGILNQLRAVVNEIATARLVPSISRDTNPHPAMKMDALLHDVRVVLLAFGQTELPYCRHLAGSYDGRDGFVFSPRLGEAEINVLAAIDEVVVAADGSREQLRHLGRT